MINNINNPKIKKFQEEIKIAIIKGLDKASAEDLRGRISTNQNIWMREVENLTAQLTKWDNAKISSIFSAEEVDTSKAILKSSLEAALSLANDYNSLLEAVIALSE